MCLLNNSLPRNILKKHSKKAGFFCLFVCFSLLSVLFLKGIKYFLSFDFRVPVDRLVHFFKPQFHNLQNGNYTLYLMRECTKHV